MVKEDLSLTIAAKEILNSNSAFAELAVEWGLDTMWDNGFCINLGEFHDYKYRITEKGKAWLESLHPTG